MMDASKTKSSSSKVKKQLGTLLSTEYDHKTVYNCSKF